MEHILYKRYIYIKEIIIYITSVTTIWQCNAKSIKLNIAPGKFSFFSFPMILNNSVLFEYLNLFTEVYRIFASPINAQLNQIELE